MTLYLRPWNKYLMSIFLSNSKSAIRDRSPDSNRSGFGSPSFRDCQFDTSTMRGELVRVREEIENDLLNAVHVTHNNQVVECAVHFRVHLQLSYFKMISKKSHR
jgi:hypothetical protein